jgi:hypothetical protein
MSEEHFVKMMSENKRLYVNYARTVQTKEQQLVYECMLEKCFVALLKLPEEYQGMTVHQKMEFGAKRHSRMNTYQSSLLNGMVDRSIINIKMKMQEKEDECLKKANECEKTPDQVKSAEADTLLRVDLMRRKSCAGSKSGIEMHREIQLLEPRPSLIVGELTERKEDDKNVVVRNIPNENYESRVVTVIMNQLKDFSRYKVKVNSLLRGGMTDEELRYASRTGAKVLRRRELIDLLDIGSARRMRLQWNPASGMIFHWLSQQLEGYQFFEFRGLALEFVSRSVMSTRLKLSVSTGPPRHEMSPTSYDAEMGSASVNFIHPLECRRADRGLSYRIGCYNGRRSFDETLIDVVGPSSVGDVIGELWVIYEIHLFGKKSTQKKKRRPRRDKQVRPKVDAIGEEVMIREEKPKEKLSSLAESAVVASDSHAAHCSGFGCYYCQGDHDDDKGLVPPASVEKRITNNDIREALGEKYDPEMPWADIMEMSGLGSETPTYDSGDEEKCQK